MRPKPVVLLILDGFGLREAADDNAIHHANTPTFDRLTESMPHAQLETSGEAVGLPIGQMGNSEVGHLHIGAGRIVQSMLPRIDDAIASGALNKNNNFWLFTSLRFEVLNYFIKKSNINSFFHAEIDNLLFNFDDLDDKFNQIGHGIFVPRDGKFRAIASFIYCNRPSCLDELLSLYSPPFNPENDMQALGIYANKSKYFFSLPTESYEYTKRIWKVLLPEITNGLFDAAAIGQYCLGIDPRNP